MQLGRCCRCSPPTRIYADYLTTLAESPGPSEDVVAALGAEPEWVRPESAAELSDCRLYTIGCFGFSRKSPSSVPGNGGVWNLTALQQTTVVDWVLGGGKLVICVDYRNLIASPTYTEYAIDQDYFDGVDDMCDELGLDWSITPYDGPLQPGPPHPLGQFIQSGIADGNTDYFEYDNAAGSQVDGTDGITVYNGTNQRIAYAAAGSVQF